MRLPVRSERDAFRASYAAAALVGLCVLVGYLTVSLAGLLLFFAVLLALSVRWLASSDPRGRPHLGEAQHAGRSHGAGHRVLVVANEAVTGDELRDVIVRDHGTDAVIEVLAPVLESRTHFVTTDVDRETAAARRRLGETLRWAREQGFRATGEVGDPIDPLEGIADELRRYEVDEVIVATHPLDDANWIEQQMLDRLRGELDVPVEHVVVG